MRYFGDFTNGSTVRLYFTTNNSSGAAVAPSDAFEAADVRIYKNGSATEKTTTNGVSVTSPFDSIVGVHLVEIDTSNNTGDAGFFAAGNDYCVILSPDTETVDSQSVAAVVGSFSVENRHDYVTAFGPPTAAAISDAVWDEAQSGHTSAGTFGSYLDAAVSSVGGGGGGDATEAKQDEIINLISGGVVLTQSALPTTTQLEIIRGDAYDGTANSGISIETGKDLTGSTVTTTIRDDETDVVLLSVAGSISGTAARVTFTTSETASLPVGTHKFDIELDVAATGEKRTLALGKCVVLEDQTRES